MIAELSDLLNSPQDVLLMKGLKNHESFMMRGLWYVERKYGLMCHANIVYRSYSERVGKDFNVVLEVPQRKLIPLTKEEYIRRQERFTESFKTIL